MRQSALAAIATFGVLLMAGCGSDPSTRLQLVADACQLEADDVPAEDEWEVDSSYGAPTIYVNFDDGGTAEIEMTDDTTVDNIEKNLRISSVLCNVDGKVLPDDEGGADDGDDFVSYATWSPDGESYTLDTTEYANWEDLPISDPDFEFEESPTETPESEHTAEEPVEGTEQEGLDGPIRPYQGDGLSADEVAEYVVTSGMLPEATLSNFSCSEGPFLDGNTATCGVDSQPNSFTILAAVHITARGMWITLIAH
jgi:hypothetical protein